MNYKKSIIIISLLLCIPLFGIASAAVGDTILFEQVNISSNITQVWNNGTFWVWPVVQGVTSVNNIDVSKTTFDGLAIIYPLNSDMRGQQFQPTKSQITKVSLNLTKIGSPTGDVEVSIRANNASDYPSDTILASTTIAASSISTSPSGYTEFLVPCVVPTDAKLWVVMRSTSGTWDASNYVSWGRISTGGPYSDYRTNGDSTSGVWSSRDNNLQHQLITYYAKNTESTNITVNGNTTMLDTGDAFGMPSGSILNTISKTFEYDNGFNATSSGKFSDVYLASPGGYTSAPIVINGWGWVNTAESIQSASDTTARNVTFKIKPILPVNGLNITVTGFNNNVNTGLVELSGDGSTYTTIWDLSASASAQTNTISTGHVNGNTSIYLRLSKDTTNGYIRWDDLKVVALVNTSTIETPPLMYHSGTNTVNITSDGRAVSGNLDPSLMANVSLVGGVPVTSITADFTASNTTGIQPLLVQFTDISTTTDATINAWAWDFGDGNTSTSRSPIHTYEVPGTYSANLTITNTSYSLVSTKLMSITVYKQPVDDFTSFNTVGTAPFTTYLYNTSTNLNPGPYTHYWDLGDGNTSTSQNLYYTWNITGTYDVKHCITDSVTTACNNRTAYVTVGTPTPPVVAPVSSFYGGPQLGAPPLQVFFTDVSTNTPTSWLWEFGDGTTNVSQNPIKWYNQSGFFTVNLTATNSAGSNITSQQNFVMVY